MSTAFAALALLALVVMLIGIVLGIFVRGRRRTGWKVAGLGLVAFFVSVGLTSYTANKAAPEQAVAATSITTDNSAVPTIEALPTTEAPSQVAERFGAEALSAYCDGHEKTIAVIREADEKFGVSGTDEKMEWIDVRDEEIGRATEKAIGGPFTEWQPVAQQQNWDQRCQGMERGWLLIEITDLSAADDGDAHVIRRTLQGIYDDKVKLGADLPFSRYHSASCERKELDGYHFVGCKLLGGQGGRHSDPFIYFVGSKDGASVIAPFDNDARDHLTQPSFHDSDPNKTEMPVGWYVGPRPFPVHYGDVRALFE